MAFGWGFAFAAIKYRAGENSGEWGTRSNADTNAKSGAYPHTESNANTNSHSCANSHTDASGDADSHATSDAYPWRFARRANSA